MALRLPADLILNLSIPESSVRRLSKVTDRQRLRNAWAIILVVYKEMFRTRAFVVSAAMAFYFLLSIIPLLFVFSAVLGFLPIHNLFGQLLQLMAMIVPPDAMTLVKHILASVLGTHGGLLSFGIFSYLWTASGGFSATIGALNIAYDVKVERSWWRDRVQALLLTFTTGALSTVALLCVIAGPHFGHFLVRFFDVPVSFGLAWPIIRTATMFVCIVIATELLYYFGPNLKQSFLATLPGALVAVCGFFLGSAALDVYFGHFSNYNKTYGSLGAVIILMLWFYVIGLFILIGAEVNAEMTKRRTILAQSRQVTTLERAIPGAPAA